MKSPGSETLSAKRVPNATDVVRYAIGDVHGEADKLAALHDEIFALHATNYPGAPFEVVHLGDYIDRGPDSCRALDLIIALETQFENDPNAEIVALRGNHEQMVLDAFDAGPADAAWDHWIANGGDATLDSYVAHGRDPMDPGHLAWLERLPLIHTAADISTVFVHAGVSAAHYPRETAETYLWTRAATFFDPDRWVSPALRDMTVVHGHTVSLGGPDIAGGGRRINVDTGAVFGGALTAAILVPGEAARFLSV